MQNENNECLELGDTVQLLSIAVKPLTEKTSNDSDEVQQVLKPFKQVY